MGTPLDRAIQQKAAIVPIDSAEARSMCRFSPLHRHKASEFFYMIYMYVYTYMLVYVQICILTKKETDK